MSIKVTSIDPRAIADDYSGALFEQWSQEVDVQNYPNQLQAIYNNACEDQSTTLLGMLAHHMTVQRELCDQLLDSVDNSNLDQLNTLAPRVPGNVIAVALSRVMREGHIKSNEIVQLLSPYLPRLHYLQLVKKAGAEGHDAALNILLNDPAHIGTHDEVFWSGLAILLLQAHRLPTLEGLLPSIPSPHHDEVLRDVLSASIHSYREEDVRWALDHGAGVREAHVQLSVDHNVPEVLQHLLNHLDVGECAAWEFNMLRDATFSQKVEVFDLLYDWCTPSARQKVMNEVQAHLDYYHPDNTELHPHTPIKYKAMERAIQVHATHTTKEVLEQSLNTASMPSARAKKI